MIGIIGYVSYRKIFHCLLCYLIDMVIKNVFVNKFIMLKKKNFEKLLSILHMLNRIHTINLHFAHVDCPVYADMIPVAAQINSAILLMVFRYFWLVVYS